MKVLLGALFSLFIFCACGDETLDDGGSPETVTSAEQIRLAAARNLYTANCARSGCHGSVDDFNHPNASPARIKSALQTNGTMVADEKLQNRNLSDDEIAEISFAVSNL